MSTLSGLHRKTRKSYRTDVNNPDAAAICDGCGFLVNHGHLREKRDYRGGSVPVGLGLWVCATCDDVPNPFYSKLVLAPDPVPVDNPRSPAPDSTSNSGYGYLVTGDGNFLVTDQDTWDWSWLITQNASIDSTSEAARYAALQNVSWR